MDAISKELREWGYSIKSRLIKDDFDGIKGSHTHEVTISLGDKSMTCEYTAGCSHRHKPGHLTIGPKLPYNGRITVYDRDQNLKTVPNDPTLEDVMYAVLSDASVGRSAMSFGEFCDEFGYDEDSRKAFSVYQACLDQYTKLRRLGADLDALDDLLSDF